MQLAPSRTRRHTQERTSKASRFTARTYPSGWKYSLHYGRIDGTVLLRYDNAHERTKGHERHTAEGVEHIEFPGMDALYDRFLGEIGQFPP